MACHDRDECSTCKGDGELIRTGEDGCTHAAIVKARIDALTVASQRTRRLARCYLAENGFRMDRRVLDCLIELRSYALSIAIQRESRGLLPGERYAWCVACRGTGLADNACEGCGDPVALSNLNAEAIDSVNVLVHRGCDTGHDFFEREPVRRPGENYFASQDVAGWR